MRSPRSASAAALCLLLAGALRAQTSACEDLSQLDGLVPYAVTSLNVPGINVQISKNGLVRYEKAFGTYTIDEVVPIASGSKWLSAACILTLVDQNKLSLDDKLSRFLPALSGAKGNITIRQCLAHTSGMVVDDASLSATTITLAQCADYCAALPLEASPGVQFNYGEVSMQIAGRCAEIASGKSWETLFQQNIAGPLGMTKTDYRGLGTTTNPRVGAGARSSLRDYGTFLRMILNGGMHGSTRILSTGAITQMLADQTNGAILKSRPFPDPRRYGLGCWRDRVNSNGGLEQASSQGIYGFSPWIDFDRRMTGVFLLRDSLVHVFPVIDIMQAVIRDVMNPMGVSCIGVSTYACQNPIVHNAMSVPRPWNQDFGVIAFGAPPQAAGLLVFASKPWVVGWELSGALVYLDTSSSAITVPVDANAVGEAWVPLPIPAIASGSKFYTQFLFLKPQQCQTGTGVLAATNALSVILQ